MCVSQASLRPSPNIGCPCDKPGVGRVSDSLTCGVLPKTSRLGARLLRWRMEGHFCQLVEVGVVKDDMVSSYTHMLVQARHADILKIESCSHCVQLTDLEIRTKAENP